MGQIFNQCTARAREEAPLLALILLAAASVVAAEALQSNRFRSHRSRSYQRPGHASARPPAVQLPRIFDDWRANFLARAAPHDPHGLARGIFLGDDSSIPSGTRDLFRSAGLSHLLAASGFNCWIVAVFFGAFGLSALQLVARSGWLSGVAELGLRRWLDPGARLGGAWLFWSWTDQSPPITRAVVLVSSQFVLRLAGLRAPFGRVLLVQYLVSLALVPRLWQSVSFQLTFGCLFGLVLFPPLVARFAPRDGIVGPAVFGYFTSGFGASIGAAPTTFLAFGEINFTGLLTNWFSVPLVSFALMPVALVEMLLSFPLWTVEWQGTAWLAGWLAELLNALLARYMSVAPTLTWHP